MAILTADGVNFGTNDNLNSKRGIFPQHVNSTNACVWIFYQNTTPTGWTKVSQNNKALRVVSGSGGGDFGTNSFTSTFSPKTLGGPGSMSVSGGASPLSQSQIPNHSHSDGGQIGLNVNPYTLNPDGSLLDYTGGDVKKVVDQVIYNYWIRTAVFTTGGVSSPTPPSSPPHSHPQNSASFTVPGQTVTLNVQYIDIIFCTFNG